MDLANPGSSGDQQPAGSASQEAQHAEHQTPDLASGHDEPRIPKSRLDQVLRQNKELKAQLEKQQQAPVSQPPVGDTDFQAEIAKWQKVAQERYDDPAAYSEAMSNISSLNAKAATSELMAQLMQQQEQVQQLQRTEQLAEKAWTQALSEFPDLRDQNSVLYKEALKELEADETLHNNPRGALYAARSAALRLGSNRGAPNERNQLEAGGPAMPKSESAERAEKKAEVMKQLAKGNRDAVSNYLQDLFDGKLR